MKIQRILLLIIFFWLNHNLIFAHQLEFEVKKLAKRIENQLLKHNNSIVIAVKPFRAIGEKSIQYRLADYVTDMLTTELIRSAKMEVIENGQIESSSNFMTNSTDSKLDYLQSCQSLGATAIMWGTVISDNKFCRVNVKIVDIQSRALIFSDFIQFKIVTGSPIKATVRSLILPGWGQCYFNQKTKGRLIMAAEAGFVATATYMYFRNKTANKNLSSAKTVEEKYMYHNIVSHSHQIHYVCVCTAIGIWLYNIIDAHLSATSSEFNWKFTDGFQRKGLMLLAENKDKQLLVKVQYGVSF